MLNNQLVQNNLLNKKPKIYIAGSDSVVGKNIFDKLLLQGKYNIVATTHRELDLTRQREVEEFFEHEEIDYVFLLAAYARDVIDNKKKPFLNYLENSIIQNNIFSCCNKYNIKRLIYFSSDSALSDIQGKILTEDDLLTANLPKHFEPYALAKLCGTKLCNYYNIEVNNTCFVALLPCIIYGGLKVPSLIFSLIKDFHKAKIEKHGSVVLWGSAETKYQLLHFSDVADAAILLMNEIKIDDIYIVSSYAYTKKQVAELIKKIIGYTGCICFDETKLTRSTMRETSSIKLRNFGWSQRIDLETGLRSMYELFLKNIKLFFP